MQTTESNRATITCVVLVTFSLVSLASGVRGGVIEQGIKTLVGVAMMPFLVAIDSLEDGTSYVTGYFTEYDEMRESLRKMNEEYAQLQKQTSRFYELRAENERLRTMMNFTREETQFDLHPAEVLQHSQGVLTIDVGSRYGVKESMCVVTAEGIIGMVTQVGPYTSNVITLQNADCRVDAMIDWNRVRGQVQGTGNDLSKVCEMLYIDFKDEVLVGDLVVTSPDSVFPSGYPIGRVQSKPVNHDLDKSVWVAPLADPFSVDEVFVLFRADLKVEDLAYEVEIDDGEVEQDETLLDFATIQERYAP